MNQVRIGIIYKITNLITSFAYIGQTVKTRAKRWSEHVKAANDGTSQCTIHRAIAKHGKENFRIRTLKRVTEPLLNAAEVYFVARHDTYRHGYNMTPGGDGYQIDAATRKKISRSNKGKVRTVKMIDAMSAMQTKRFSKKKARTAAAIARNKSYIERPEQRIAISASITALWQDPAYRSMMIEARKARWENPAEIEKLSKAHLGKPWSAKQRVAHDARKAAGLTKLSAEQCAVIGARSQRVWDALSAKEKSARGLRGAATRLKNGYGVSDETRRRQSTAQLRRFAKTK